MTIKIVVSALVLMLLLFAYYIWPTPYVIKTARYGNVEYVIAINRFTYNVITIFPDRD